MLGADVVVTDFNSDRASVLNSHPCSWRIAAFPSSNVVDSIVDPFDDGLLLQFQPAESVGGDPVRLVPEGQQQVLGANEVVPELGRCCRGVTLDDLLRPVGEAVSASGFRGFSCESALDCLLGHAE